MVTPIVGQQAEATKQAEAELRIDMSEWMVMYVGCAAQLKAEGLIPADLEWPRAKAIVSWQTNGLSFWLCRTRPEGHKGPPSSWWNLDSWALRSTVIGRDCGQRRLERMAADLKAARYRASEAGQREWTANYWRHVETQKDQAFQAFKALVPGLVQPKRGRKPKAPQ